MDERREDRDTFGWSRAATSRRQRRAGLSMTPAERLDWLEKMLDELLPLLGRARQAGREHSREPRHESS
ncbi:MAG: hypothetical protein GXP47_01675 [Acidobacteria bacterium]|nr:hypothetical protein [Acidobacteriota bacterium]